MRPALLALAVVLAALAADVRSGSAQFNNRFCSEGGGQNSSGDLDCSFSTREQCVATARGLNKSCIENPSLQWQQRRGGYQAQPRNNQRDRGY